MRTLTDEEEARAERLHRESLVIDSMGQFGPSVYTPEMLSRIDELAARGASASAIVVEMATAVARALPRDDLPGFWEGWDQAGVDVSSVTIGSFGQPPWSFENAVRDAALFGELFDRLGDRLVRVSAPGDVERARRDGKRGVILNFQNTLAIGDDLANLELFHGVGLRIMQLTYNERNLVGDGCTERVQAGLSHLGVAMVKRMNELGIMVDTGHCSDATTLDALEVSERPVAVSHSFCRSVSRHDRGKGDDVVRAVGEQGGFFGVVVVPFFITDDPNATLDHWLAHVERAAELAGPEHVGIGTDWGEELPKRLEDLLNEEMRAFGFREEHRVDWAATVGGYRSWREWPNLTRALVAAGFSDQEIQGFLGGNFRRVFEAAIAP
ncbi:MAG TPA: membrane dipeptidase [Actinomycetota bacterium]|nr:membrane dipeptidase [Actinomycetota bacterium]